MSEARTRLISKVRKLLSLAAGRASIEEASSAAAKAQELIERYKIKQAEMDTEGAPHAGIGSMALYRMELRTPKGHGLLVLTQDLAPVFDCYAFTFADPVAGDWAVLVGEKSDMETAAAMLRFLAKAIDTETARREMSVFGASYENGFQVGMVDRLVERLTEIRAGLRSGASERALIVLRDKAQAAEKMVKDTLGAPVERKLRRKLDPEAEYLGSLAGDRVELTPKLGAAHV